mgnify:CR=1 FL=1
MVEQSQTEILVCPNHGPMSNRDAKHYQDRIGVVISCCPVCGRALEFVEMGEDYTKGELYEVS